LDVPPRPFHGGATCVGGDGAIYSFGPFFFFFFLSP